MCRWQLDIGAHGGSCIESCVHFVHIAAALKRRPGVILRAVQRGVCATPRGAPTVVVDAISDLRQKKDFSHHRREFSI